MKLVEVSEGPVVLKVAAANLVPPHKADVFYNPHMAKNRAFSSLALGAILPRLDGSVVLDAFCAGGARGIRYAVENSLERIVFLDANPAALELCRKNASRNGLKNALFFEGFFEDYPDKVDVVEVDPFGSPAPFLDQALALLNDSGVLSVTATDLATLCGRNNAPAARRYDAQPLYADYAHELGLRIVLGAMARKADAAGKAVRPLFSWYQDHYVKIFAEVRKTKEGKKVKPPLGFVSHCLGCGNRKVGKKKRCDFCGQGMKTAGPLWVGDVNDSGILSAMKKNLLEKTKNQKDALAPLKPDTTLAFLDVLENESGLPPYHFDAHKLASKLKVPIVKMETYLDRLRRKKCRAVRTHYAATAFKTDAPFEDVIQAISVK